LKLSLFALRDWNVHGIREIVNGIVMALQPMVQGREAELSGNTRVFLAIASGQPSSGCEFSLSLVSF
jgi:hypothetical protein